MVRLPELYLSDVDILPGIGLNLILAPLAATMFQQVGILAEDHSETFGTVGAYPQAYSMLCCAVGLGTALGPILAGTLFEKASWQATQIVSAVVCFLGSLIAYFFTGRNGVGKKRVRFESITHAIP